MKNGKQPITPSMWTRCGDEADDFEPLKDGKVTGYETKFGGLTKREYLSAKAMQGLLSNTLQIGGETDFSWLAVHAVGYADALLKELDKANNP